MGYDLITISLPTEVVISVGVFCVKLSKGILYHYFTNKDTLYLFCLQKCMEEFIGFMESNLDSKWFERRFSLKT